MENKESITGWKITGWSLPDQNMVHVIIKNAKTGEEEHKSYKQRWSFIKFMGFHGLFNEAWEIAANVWNR